MQSITFKIVVSGDICINSLYWITDPQNTKGFNWQNSLNMHSVLLPGEALLLAKLVTLATDACIVSPQIQDIESVASKEYLRAVAEAELCPVFATKEENDKVYRVKRFLGFSGPSSGITKLLPICNDDANADMIIIDDENNGYHSDEDFWPLALTTPNKTPIVLYKMSNPVSSTKLWKKLESSHLDKMIVIINSDDLRSKGVNISRSLSWERTAQDFVWQINNSPNLAFLAQCRHLVVLFGLEGAIYYKGEGVPESRLYFLPYQFEGGSMAETQGKMAGLTSCFVAGIARSIASRSDSNEGYDAAIGEGIREGIVASQKYFIEGFGKNIEADHFPSARIFLEEESGFICKDHVQDVVIQPTDSQSCWYILKENSTTNLAVIAYNIVKKGVQHALKFIPIAQFGKLQTVDRSEIESCRSIKNLIAEYISSVNSPRPLCIAVFGTPGSGKSFGVTEIASSVAPELVKKVSFNLSQLSSPLDLIKAFHKVRDLCLEGKLPLVFFDEFDSSLEGKLGWLKHFLAPMQDGVFKEGDSLHPIGKAIFVFAGGTSSTFNEFCGEEIEDEQDHERFLLEFKHAKGPDFLSRLRGYVNILGPNQTNRHNDQLFIIRRSMLLRALLEKKTPNLINDRGEAQIDDGVLRALLKIPRYKHESRSVEAIIEMSLLTNAKKWEQSYLPSKEQLRLHVDEEAFLRHLMHDTFFSEKIEGLAIAIYERYRELNEHTADINSERLKPWEELDEDHKESAREQARNIPNALLTINYDVISVEEKPAILEFTEEELDMLVAYEHTYWDRNRKGTDKKPGNRGDKAKQIGPSLVNGNSLSKKEKKKVYQMVAIWPEILANANFKIERLKFICD